MSTSRNWPEESPTARIASEELFPGRSGLKLYRASRETRATSRYVREAAEFNARMQRADIEIT